MKTQRRTYDIVAGRRIRAGLWNSWCRIERQTEAPSLFSWGFLRSIWSLLWQVAWRRTGRNSAGRFAWKPEALGCAAPRSTAVYGRLR